MHPLRTRLTTLAIRRPVGPFQLHPFRAAQASFHTSQLLRQSEPNAHRNFYRVYGRALAKALTLAFLSYQIAYTVWLTLETEAIKDEKNRDIKSLESEVRLLDEGRKMHSQGSEVVKEQGGKRLLETETRGR